MTPDDLLTKKDLEEFKKELFALLKSNPETSGAKEKKWMRSKDVCKLLDISSSTLQGLRIAGKLGFYKVGSIFFYKPEDIDKMLGNSEKKSTNKKKE